MDLANYLEPVDVESNLFLCEGGVTTLATVIKTHTSDAPFPEPTDGSVVLLGVLEDRGAVGNKGCDRAPDQIRHFLYGLSAPYDVESSSKIDIFDIGNIPAGSTTADTYYAVTQVLQYLFEHNVNVVLLGGGQDISFAVYKAYEVVGRVVNICSVDPRLDIAFSENIDSHSYVNHIVMQQPNFLFNYSVVGYQSYFVSPMHLRLMNDLHFDAYRLGVLREDLYTTEPLVRNADFVSVDISAVRQSDAPANAHPSPHGFYGEELCQIAKFSGLNDKLSCFGIFELNPLYDREGQTAHMVAHAIWYFIEGVSQRKADFPYVDTQNYRQFIVELDQHGLELTFFKSRKSDRWWIQLPCENEELRSRYVRQLFIPCNYSDYEKAVNNEIPDLWWRYYQRMQ